MACALMGRPELLVLDEPGETTTFNSPFQSACLILLGLFPLVLTFGTPTLRR